MGLDMHLTLHRYLSPSDADDAEDIKEIEKIGKRNLLPQSVVYRAAYWRKANHIHRWFVNFVQNGNDDCKSYYVSRQHLLSLLDLCKKVEADVSKASKLLPTQQGFFFGSLEYDEGYWHDIRITIEQLETALAAAKAGDYFEYCASW